MASDSMESRTPHKRYIRMALYSEYSKMFALLIEAEIDIEDLLSNPFNTQPPSLDQLQQLTGFDRQWLMFMYRNFKQKCSNGRMTITDWRSIFRTIFPYSANNQFADRLYNAIANAHDHPHITFEDLILCLWELTEGARNSDLSHEQQPGVSVKAQFVFGLMAPDARGRVDEAAFYEYVHSVFNLYGSKKMDDSVTLGLPPSSLHQRMTVADVRPLPPNVRKFAVERFRSLDENNDGFITVYDIEREMNEGRGLVLLSLRDIDQASNEEVPNVLIRSEEDNLETPFSITLISHEINTDIRKWIREADLLTSRDMEQFEHLTLNVNFDVGEL
ncbi:unnamed protein product [Nippostrongylus brasiliensis]|uniref:EF-hand domain-containing protein n=1 Tax=Nippostrongylus brasiliensis TaxID=27835 RepID=A0A0N4XU99_NIPBR|nr:unnamed protein product [Nippostrongylus brasiliensis]